MHATAACHAGSRASTRAGDSGACMTLRGLTQSSAPWAGTRRRSRFSTWYSPAASSSSRMSWVCPASSSYIHVSWVGRSRFSTWYSPAASSSMQQPCVMGGPCYCQLQSSVHRWALLLPYVTCGATPLPAPAADATALPWPMPPPLPPPPTPAPRMRWCTGKVSVVPTSVLSVSIPRPEMLRCSSRKRAA